MFCSYYWERKETIFHERHTDNGHRMYCTKNLEVKLMGTNCYGNKNWAWIIIILIIVIFGFGNNNFFNNNEGCGYDCTCGC